jgi:hypothetical protein
MVIWSIGPKKLESQIIPQPRHEQRWECSWNWQLRDLHRIDEVVICCSKHLLYESTWTNPSNHLQRLRVGDGHRDDYLGETQFVAVGETFGDRLLQGLSSGVRRGRSRAPEVRAAGKKPRSCGARGGEEAALEDRAEQFVTGRNGRDSLSGPFGRWAVVLGLRQGHRPTDCYFIGRLGAGASDQSTVQKKIVHAPKQVSYEYKSPVRKYVHITADACMHVNSVPRAPSLIWYGRPSFRQNSDSESDIYESSVYIYVHRVILLIVNGFLGGPCRV